MKRKKIGHTVFVRYTLAMVVVVLASFLALTGIISLVVDRYYVDHRQNELARMASSAKNIIEIDSLYTKFLQDSDDFYESVYKRLGAISQGTTVFFLLVDEEGRICGYDQEDPPLVFNEIDWQLIETLRKEGTCHGSSLNGVFEESHFYHALPLNVDGEIPISFVFACISYQEVRAPILYTVRLILYSCFVALAVAVLIAYVVSRNVTKPLVIMRNAVSAFANGDFSVRVPYGGMNELSELARVFNGMADNLENLEKTRNDFVANVSHDLRSPMTSIIGFIDGMLNGVIPPEKWEHYLRLVLNESTRLSRLVSTLLDISRIQAGERKFHMVTFNVCELARQVIISLEKRLEEKKLDVSFAAEEDPIYVKADIDAIYQVVYNVCDNAVKFADEGKVFAVSVSVSDDIVRLEVFNEGCGIASEDMSLVFERFHKGDKSRGLDKAGTGLGMYISKKIMDAHNQRIGVESECGKNCRFYITLEKTERPKFGRGVSIPEN